MAGEVVTDGASFYARCIAFGASAQVLSSQWSDRVSKLPLMDLLMTLEQGDLRARAVSTWWGRTQEDLEMEVGDG